MRKGSIGLLCVCAVLGVAALAVFAESPASPAPPKPGPEHQRLGYFAGKWSSEGTMSASPFGPGGKMTGKEDCEWFDGKFAIVCRTEGESPMGKSKGIGIMSYNADEKTYTYYGTDSLGQMIMTTVPRGTVAGDTWTYNDESKMGGQTVKSRYIMKELSPTSYTFKWEMLGPDSKWMTVMEGKNTKLK